MNLILASLFVVLATVHPSAPTPPTLAVPPPFASEEALRHYTQGRLLEERGLGAEALREYFKALLLDDAAPSIARRASEVAAVTGEPSRSLELAEKTLALDPHDARALWLKGSALLNLDRGDEAQGPLEAAVAIDSNRAEYLTALARSAELHNRVREVARCYARVVWLDEEDGEAWFQLAAAEARLGHFGAADTALGESMAINPMRPGALFLGGWIRESLGDRVHALELYRQHLGVHPDDQMTRRREINLLVGENRMREAYQEARVAAKANPGDLDTREVEADLAFRSGEAAEGERLLGRLRAEHPDDPQVLALAVGVLSRHGRGRTGVEWAEQWSTARSGDYRAQLVAARARALNREPQQALAHYQTALRLAPDSLAPYVMLARFHQDEKRWREAEEVWTEASRRFPAENGLAFDLAGCREHLGDLTGAEHAVRDVLTREPANPSALNFLGYLWADHNMNLEEALGFILEAVGSEPGNGAYIDSLGWVYYRLGRLGDAREQLEQAVRLTGGDPVVREHLGDVYKDLKLLDLAREQYRLSAAADHDNSRVRAKLAALR